jgi:hypothetical protein
MADRPVVLLGVTGGIAAYKAAELLRGLQKAGMEVRGVMTDVATRFVGPMTFEVLSGAPVRLDHVSELRADSRITHVEDSREADIMVVAPATANTVAKMANGIADNLLTSMFLAFGKTVVIAPAMNTNMWEHPATQYNVRLLRERGVFVSSRGLGSWLREISALAAWLSRTASLQRSNCGYRCSVSAIFAACACLSPQGVLGNPSTRCGSSATVARADGVRLGQGGF